MLVSARSATRSYVSRPICAPLLPRRDATTLSSPCATSACETSSPMLLRFVTAIRCSCDLVDATSTRSLSVSAVECSSTGRRASQRKRRLGEHPRDFRARLGLQVGDDGNRNFIEGRAVREGLHAGVASQHVRDLSQEIATPLARRLLGEIQQQSKFRCRSGHEAYGSCV